MSNNKLLAILKSFMEFRELFGAKNYFKPQKKLGLCSFVSSTVYKVGRIFDQFIDSSVNLRFETIIVADHNGFDKFRC